LSDLVTVEVDPFSGNAFTRPYTKSIFSDDPIPAESEDCLFINVFAPAAPGNYPVMFWIYGGSWEFGDSSQNWYNGSHFAALENVVVVTFNYRTNGKFASARASAFAYWPSFRLSNYSRAAC
jgi:carboxylesterase type B